MKQYLVFVLLAALCSVGFQGGGVDYRALHKQLILVDTHNDVAQRMLDGEDISVRTKHGHSDLPRFVEGGVDAAIFSIWVPPEKTSSSYYAQANEQIDSIESFIKKNPSRVRMALAARQVVGNQTKGLFSVILGLEGGHAIERSLENLERFRMRGVRYMTLTWNNSTGWATSAKDETDTSLVLKEKGLTEWGKKVILKMNGLGMIVDVSHVGEETFWDVIETTRAPVIASHSSAYALCPHRRNLKDDQLRAVAESGGVVCINFAPWFIDSTFGAKEAAMLAKNKERIDAYRATLKGKDEFIQDMLVAEFLAKEYKAIRPTLKQLVDHIDYVAKLIGTRYVGIGSDFDGISVTPLEMDDVTFLPNITRELLARGYTEEEIRRIMGENFLRVFAQTERHW